VTSRPAERPPRTAVAAGVITGFVVLLYLIEAVDTLTGQRLDALGVRPRQVDGLDGIAFAPLLHASWAHLVSNTPPLLLFGFLILLAGVARWLAVTAVVWVVGGAGTWLIGPTNSLHLGASVLAFGWLVYLLLRGVFSNRMSHVLLGVLLLVLYGGLLLGLAPGRPGVSWQGHLFGAIGGAIAAWWWGGRDRFGSQSPGR
jgi:membrane associated rhomboid family serine protease